MIDRMIRCKDLNSNNSIECIHEWLEKCPPQGKDKHWVNGRSARETAKHWVHTIPSQFLTILKSFNLKYLLCSPEFVTKFDVFGGNGRNHDLLIIAENEQSKKVVVAVESKVDESFGPTVGERINSAQKTRVDKPNSKAYQRITGLHTALFGTSHTMHTEIRYQLLTAIAGTVAEAKAQNAGTAIFLVQTFISEELNPVLHKQNQDDLDAFIALLNNGKKQMLHDGCILGPFNIPGNTKHLSSDIDLWIGKYSINI